MERDQHEVAKINQMEHSKILKVRTGQTKFAQVDIFGLIRGPSPLESIEIEVAIQKLAYVSHVIFLLSWLST